MDVLLVSDFGIHHNVGGAQRSNDLIMQEGVRRDHNIEVFHHDSDPSLLNNNYDIVISSNLHAISSSKPDIIDYLTSVYHVRLEHDFNLYLTARQRKKLFVSCKKTFFLTDYHYYKFVEYFGDFFVNVVVVPDPIDQSVFYNYNTERSESIIYTGLMHHLKGTDNFIRYVKANPHKHFIVAAWGSAAYENQLKRFANVDFLGALDFTAMPEFYNAHHAMYYNPNLDEPFCRSVGEALMCGMEIIGDPENVGCLHFYNKIGGNEFADRCHHAASNFWEILEDV